MKKIIAFITALTTLASASVSLTSASAATVLRTEDCVTTAFDFDYDYAIIDETLYIGGATIVGAQGVCTKETYPWDSERENITTIVIGSNVESVEAYAFADMPNLTSVKISDKAAVSFGYATFKGDSALESITLNENSSFGFLTFDKDSDITVFGYILSKAHRDCLKYGINFESIGEAENPVIQTNGYLYDHSDSTVDLDLETRTLYITSNEDITPLEEGVYQASNRKIIGYEDVFNYADYITGEVSYTTVPIYEDTWLYQGDVSTSLTFKAVLSGDIKRIDSMFSAMKYLTEVELLETLEYIGTSTFEGTNIETIKLPENVKVIGKDAFLDCYNLKNVYIPEDIESIDGTAFTGCFKDNLTIYGYGGSVAEKYAAENGINFVDVTTSDFDFSITGVMGDINGDGTFNQEDLLKYRYNVYNVESKQYYEQIDQEDLNAYLAMETIDDGVTVTISDLADSIEETTEITTENLTEITTDSSIEIDTNQEVTEISESTDELPLLLGDANVNGDLDIADVILINKSILGAATLNDYQQKVADYNEDGQIDSIDSLEILKKTCSWIIRL